MACGDILRISREVADLQTGSDLSLAVACQESDMRNLRALIVGPPGTPYEYGFFEFSVKFGSDYPTKPPKVEARTTNSGRCRFNPNIYAGGKVCLSILGTWEGESGEQWSPAQGLESILLSIQSLMSNNPYANEPGFEDSKGDKDKTIREAYCAKIIHETIRIAVIEKLERMLGIKPSRTSADKKALKSYQWVSDSDDEMDPSNKATKTALEDAKSKIFEPFNDLMKRRFLWYYDTYLKTVQDNAAKHADGKIFQPMPFESPTNGMEGHFEYGELEKRLVRLKETLYQESSDWTRQGLAAVEQELTVAYSLQRQFDQFLNHQRGKEIHNIDVSLVDKNPFVWMLTYFGRSESNLDGGIFRIRISLSPKFPEEQPRVRFETKIYHHRVSKDGAICYFPVRTDEVKYHVEAIVLAIEEVSPPYDPRAIVHPEATRLYWSSDENKKKYNRAQRRSAEESLEDTA